MLNARVATSLMEGERPGDKSNVADALVDITTAAGHTSDVLERLRALFRRERVEHRPVDVKELIEDAVQLLHTAMLIEGIDIRLVLGDALPAVFGDPVQLEQVLLNVLLNARDAISASSSGHGPRVITIRARQQPPSSVIIEVADTGVGVPKENLEHIFGHFVSTKPSGLGMGLAISRSIIEVHGGRIWGAANPEGGLTVHIELPCSDEKAGRTEKAEKAEKAVGR
ncbi:MAG TPA: ATP-binding protein, partial [Gemmatimonadales bacterium]